MDIQIHTLHANSGRKCLCQSKKKGKQRMDEFWSFALDERKYLTKMIFILFGSSMRIIVSRKPKGCAQTLSLAIPLQTLEQIPTKIPVAVQEPTQAPAVLHVPTRSPAILLAQGMCKCWPPSQKAMCQRICVAVLLKTPFRNNDCRHHLVHDRQHQQQPGQVRK